MKPAAARFIAHFCQRAMTRQPDTRPVTRDQLRAVVREIADTLEDVIYRVQPKSGPARDEALQAVDELRLRVRQQLKTE
jgi:hypothetical protein